MKILKRIVAYFQIRIAKRIFIQLVRELTDGYYVVSRNESDCPRALEKLDLDHERKISWTQSIQETVFHVNIFDDLAMRVIYHTQLYPMEECSTYQAMATDELSTRIRSIELLNGGQVIGEVSNFPKKIITWK